MMRPQQTGVRSQPKLLTRNRTELNGEQQRDQLKMPEKLAGMRCLRENNKENQNQYCLNKAGQHESSTPTRNQGDQLRKTKPPTPTNSKNDHYAKNMHSKEKEETRPGYYQVRRVPPGATLQSTGLGNCTVITTRTRQHNELRRCEFMQMQEKVKDLESKILKIKEAIEKKPERKITIATSTLTRNYDMMKTEADESFINDSMEKFEKVVDRADTKPEKSLTNKVQKPEQKAQATIISNFVTQAPAPSQLLQCSSQTNLFSMATRQIKPAANKYYISSVLPAFLDKSNNTSFTQLCRNHLCTTLQLFKVTKSIQRPKEVQPIRQLPKSTKLNTIVFDLDETLIHCNENIDIPHDVVLPIVFPNGDGTKAGINIRPHAVECLRQLAEHFQIIVFTASHECYGTVVVEHLDPKRELISQMYFRDSCYKSPEGFYIKDLRVIDRPLDRMLLVDNAAYSYSFQVENGVPVIPFYDCKTDIELKHLSSYLKPLAQSKDLRKEHCQNLRFNQYPKFTDPFDLIHKLYGEFINKG